MSDSKEVKRLLDIFEYTPLDRLVALRDTYLTYPYPTNQFEIRLYIPDTTLDQYLRFLAEGSNGEVYEVSLSDRWTWTQGCCAECLVPSVFLLHLNEAIDRKHKELYGESASLDTLLKELE